MALNLDITRAPVRAHDLLALAQAVFDAGPADEGSWLEWKSTLDLTTKHAFVHIARAVIAFANRMPDEAARFAEGHAFLLVGISPGALDGVTPVDIVELDKGLQPYLGPDGPRWRATYLTLTRPTASAPVLIIDVEPPRWGDPIFCLRKELDGMREGTIYVRGNGESRPARAREVDALVRRVQRGARHIEVDVRLAAGAPVTPVDIGEHALQQWLTAEEQALMEPLRPQRRPEAADPARAYLASQAALRAAGESMTRALRGLAPQETPEQRTAEQYRQEIAAYLRRCAERWPRLVPAGAAAHVPPLRIELVNCLTSNLAEVELHLSVPGQASAVHPRPPGSTAANEPFVALPDRPRPFGPHRTSGSFVPGLSTPRPATVRYPGAAPTARPAIANGGSATITFPAVHLRSRQSILLPGIVLIVPAPAPSVITAEWSATSTSIDGTATGQLQIPVAAEPLTVAQLLTAPAGWYDPIPLGD
ncbi:AlbA family DNA-binding domain-containing protein [Planomonospora parontospora]|uniref:AlbA family DNA-binding domain-containing protein n=1 Tax=Planomonospora parontospora TaxID=58119 RepID=UPI0016707615|nr:hypothetical protein [Planomonospora parontospora]GGL57376.1 hypothetical protein GCM10014719_68520 [Planomonospora parontospora subsp. antibiotica]GII19991.1 hypothetical protein Ppa05_67170 [Planomonospora parontospora subsp. antibiotica]